jgi:hypothetical protein
VGDFSHVPTIVTLTVPSGDVAPKSKEEEVVAAGPETELPD